MVDYKEHSPEYLEKRFREWIIYSTGSAIIRAQYVEHVLKSICLMLGIEGLGFTEADLLSGDSTRVKQTLGRSKEHLRNTYIFDPAFIERLQVYVNRRNNLVHGLYANSFHSDDDFAFDSPIAQGYVKECEWILNEGPELVEIGFGIVRVFQEIVTPENPDYDQIVEMRRSFDEYHERGLDTFTSVFKTVTNQEK